MPMAQTCDLNKWGKEDEIEKLRLDIIAAAKTKGCFMLLNAGTCWEEKDRQVIGKESQVILGIGYEERYHKDQHLVENKCEYMLKIGDVRLDPMELWCLIVFP